MNMDLGRIDRLIDLSKSKSYDAYTRFQWPDEVPVDCLWCNEDLLTTFGTELHDALSDQQKFDLSKWEAINFYSLNVHGIKTVLEFVCRRIHDKRYDMISEYLHLFLAEENDHMWFFARFCKKYGGKIYPAVSMLKTSNVDPVEDDLYMFAGTLIFEEFVDYYNHIVGKNKNVPEIIREINYQHHVDESRHVSFGREIVKELYSEIVRNGADDAQTHRINKTFKGLILYFLGLMYNAQAYSDAGLVSSLGFSSAAAMRNNIRNMAERKPYHHAWFNRTAKFFEKTGIIDDTEFLKAA